MASIRPNITRISMRDLRHLFSAPLTSVAASVVSARRRVSPPVSVLWLGAAFLLGGLAVGSVISSQAQASVTGSLPAPASVTTQSEREIVSATIARLEVEQANLKKQIADLRAQLSTAQSADAGRKTALLDVKNEITHQRLE